MMAAIFALITAALVTGWLGKRPWAIGLVVIALVLAIHLFLWEVHSPVYGYGLPWIQT